MTGKFMRAAAGKGVQGACEIYAFDAETLESELVMSFRTAGDDDGAPVKQELPYAGGGISAVDFTDGSRIAVVSSGNEEMLIYDVKK